MKLRRNKNQEEIRPEDLDWDNAVVQEGRGEEPLTACSTQELKELVKKGLDPHALVISDLTTPTAMAALEELTERLELCEQAYLKERETPFDGEGGQRIDLDSYCMRCCHDLSTIDREVFDITSDRGEDWCPICWEDRQPIPSELRERLERK